VGERSAIEWTTATWNPWRGCDKVSPGCAHCYMFTEQRRYGRDPSVVVRCSDATFYAPLRKRAWRDLPGGALVFTCSWSDWFHEAADAWRAEAWDVVRRRPDLTFQVLTKRPERILEHLPVDWGDGWPNVWMGVTIENRRFVQRADLLRQTPAAVRFISAEPLLGPLLYDTDIGMFNDCSCGGQCDHPKREGDPYTPCWSDTYEGPELDLTGIDWLIAGGESGHGARHCDLEWLRALRDACADAGTAFFLKQLGGHPDKRGGDQALLDGARHLAMPRPAVAA
jgi:protein gp37